MCNTTENVLAFVHDVYNEIESKRESSSYPINLLEEIHLHDSDEKNSKKRVGENAHSRILCRILRFKKDGQFVLLRSLLDYVKTESKSTFWNNIDVENPRIDTEVDCSLTSGRVDLLIEEEGKYSIIIENKINDANDQTSQLGRYIKNQIRSGYNKEQIYVLYLSSEGDDPTNQSWTYDGDNYRSDFIPRYHNLSFCNGILHWLNSRVIPEVRSLKNQLLFVSALVQYENYLNRKFLVSNEDRHLLLQTINSKLKISKTDSLNDKISKYDKLVLDLKGTIKVLEEENDELARLRSFIRAMAFMKTELLQEQITISSFPVYQKRVPDRHKFLGYEIEGQNIVAYIGCNSSYYFCSIIAKPFGNPLDQSIVDRLHGLLPSGGNREGYIYKRIGSNPALGYGYDYCAAIRVLKSVLEELNNEPH